jgi:vitamin-K-epoxide reductase (warfarin-sensitive)
MSRDRVLKLIIFFGLLGAALSAYTLAYKYGATTAEFCTINATFDCGIVNQSVYSVILGIPVSALGILGYGFIALAAFLKLRSPSDKSLTTFITVAALGALAFSLYLSGIEAFVLHAWCLLCLGSQAIIIVITGFVLKLRTYDKH